MALPVALISLVAPIIERIYDKNKPNSVTNTTTIAGGSLVATAAIMINQPDETSQGIGYILGAVGFLITMYKEKNK